MFELAVENEEGAIDVVDGPKTVPALVVVVMKVVPGDALVIAVPKIELAAVVVVDPPKMEDPLVTIDAVVADGKEVVAADVVVTVRVLEVGVPNNDPGTFTFGVVFADVTSDVVVGTFVPKRDPKDVDVAVTAGCFCAPKNDDDVTERELEAMGEVMSEVVVVGAETFVAVAPDGAATVAEKNVCEVEGVCGDAVGKTGFSGAATIDELRAGELANGAAVITGGNICVTTAVDEGATGTLISCASGDIGVGAADFCTVGEGFNVVADVVPISSASEKPVDVELGGCVVVVKGT